VSFLRKVIAKIITWTPPKFSAEYEQEHHGDFEKWGFTRNKKDFLNRLKTKGKVVSFTPSQIVRIPLERYDFFSVGDPSVDLSKMTERKTWLTNKKGRDEWAKMLDSASSLPMPIIIKKGTDYICYGGRHRIGWCVYRKVTLKAWVVSADDLIMSFLKKVEVKASKDDGSPSLLALGYI